MKKENPIKEKLLEMMQWFHNFCGENEIQYYIAYGTMLGAARHKGFIPWDDDIDVVVPRKDYDKLIALLRVKIDDYIVESPWYFSGMNITPYSKLYHTGTTLIEKSKYKIKKGLYIDIFPLDGGGYTLGEAAQHMNKVRPYIDLLSAKVCSTRKGRGLLKNAAAVLGRFLPINTVKTIRKIDKLCAEKDFDSCDWVGNVMGEYKKKELFKKNIFGKPTLYRFEGLQLYGIEKYEEYLTQLYSDWRKLPSVENRKKHAHLYIDLDKGYLEDIQ